MRLLLLLGRFRRPRPDGRQPGVQIAMEGWLKRKQDKGIPGFRRWESRYVVLLASHDEIRYYGSMIPSNFGNLPLNERGSIPLEQVVDVAVDNSPKWKGLRFDLITTCNGTPYPRDLQKDQDKGAFTTGRAQRRYCFIAPSTNDRYEWVQRINTLCTLQKR